MPAPMYPPDPRPPEGGPEARTRWLTVSPAFRFTRWTVDPVGDMFSPHTYTIRNRAELLVGFSF